MAAAKYGQLQTFSVQQAIDCAGNGNMGCNGGDTCSLLAWLVDNNIKIALEKDYPLVLQTQTCKLSKFDKGVKVASNFSCDRGNENDLLTTLAHHGPVAVAVNALLWQFYLGGVIKYNCDQDGINHAVQIVGYDTTATTPHYIVRNSWGTSFGEKGYLKIAIGDNVCGKYLLFIYHKYSFRL
ncbi:hypothetical protein AAG570_008234 [Ranatra chinensis]|uniref:Peptidase C1A papain C-terminal domain-containing protein n=1 Tax=Ranatra chinensis TaxID=642074 RepID=A0ABD0XU08_9HEMI